MAAENGNLLDDDAFNRVAAATYAHEQTPTNGGTPGRTFSEEKPPLIMIAVSEFGQNKPGIGVPCRWDAQQSAWVLAGGQKQHTVYCLPGSIKNKRDLGEILFCVWSPGIGYIALGEVYWAMGSCYALRPYRVLGVRQPEGAVPANRPQGSSQFQGDILELANRIFKMTAFQVAGTSGSSSYSVPGAGPWNTQLAFTMDFNPIFGAEDGDCTNNEGELTGPVPVVMHPPAWVTYDPDGGRIPTPGEIWGVAGDDVLRYQPTAQRTVEFKHEIEVTVVLGDAPGASSGGGDECKCVVESASARVLPYTEEFVYGWAINAVDTVRGIAQIMPLHNNLAITTGRSGSLEEFEFDVLRGPGGSVINPAPSVTNPAAIATEDYGMLSVRKV